MIGIEPTYYEVPNGWKVPFDVVYLAIDGDAAHFVKCDIEPILRAWAGDSHWKGGTVPGTDLGFAWHEVLKGAPVTNPYSKTVRIYTKAAWGAKDE